MLVLLVPAILSNQAVEEEYRPDTETGAFSTVVFVLTATWSTAMKHSTREKIEWGTNASDCMVKLSHLSRS